MKIRSLLIVLCVLLPAIALGKAPNVVLILVDDLGYGDLGSYGHPTIKTPHLDALAASGLRLTQHYAPSALCSPSRGALLTGRHPYRLGIKSWIPPQSEIYLREEEITLAELFKQAGYRTALIGKWHLNSDLGDPDEPQPLDQGFDYAYGHNAYQIPTNRNPTNVFRNGLALPAQRGYTAQLYADEAIRWLSAEQKPFFLFLSMAEPHTTIENPPAYNAMYKQFTQGPVEPIPSGLPEPPRALLQPRGPGEYYANISYLDAQLGRVLSALQTLDYEKDTVVVFLSDNGPVTSQWLSWYEVNAYGDTGGFRGRKHYLYEGGIRVPALVRVPGMTRPGSTSASLVHGSDWFTTLLSLAGLKPPSDREIDGIDVTPVLIGGVASRDEREILWALDSVGPLEFAFRLGDWKLMLDREGQPQELYHLKQDPLELFNQIADQGERVADMVKRFRRVHARIQADPLRPN